MFVFVVQVYAFHQYFDWLEKVAIPSLRAASWYNGDPAIGQRGFVGDRAGRIMGYATLRQLRVDPGTQHEIMYLI